MSTAVQTTLLDTEVLETSTPAPVQAKPARSSFTRYHTAEADRQAAAIVRSLAKAGYGDEANYMRDHWLPRKSIGFIARAYAAAKANGTHVVKDMLAFERQQLTKFGSWDAIPSKIRKALS